MKIFIFIEWALFHSQSLCYVINYGIQHTSYEGQVDRLGDIEKYICQSNTKL